MVLLRSLPIRLLLTTTAVLVALVALARPASAHAVVVSSTPSDQQRLTTAPDLVSLTFSEAVTTVGPGIQVVDRNGTVVDDGPVTQPDPQTLTVALRPGLGTGTYTTTYRVISADGHPVNGAIVFAVGDTSTLDAISTATGDPWVEFLGAVFRFLTYLGALLAAGIAFFTVFIDDVGPEEATLMRVVRTAVPVSLVASVGTIVVQTALATGKGVGAALDPALVRQSLVNGLGWNVAVLMASLAALLIGLTRRGLSAQIVVFYATIGVGTSFALWGHASEGPNRWLAMGSAALHTIVAAIWLGGVVALTITLRIRGSSLHFTEMDRAVEADADEDPRPDPYATGRIVARFSTAAAASLVLLIVAGGALAWTQVGGWSGLGGSPYGRLLIAKIVVALLVVAIAVYNHQRLLPSLSEEEEAFARGVLDDGPEAPEPRWSRLVRTARAEAIGLVAVLAITAVLVNTPPGRTVQVGTGPFNQTQTIDGGNRLNLVVSPASTGTNNIHLTYSTAGGTPSSIQKAEVQMSLPDRNVGPISRPARAAGPGHFIIDGNHDLAMAGTWTITVVTRITDFTQATTTFQVPIREP